MQNVVGGAWPTVRMVARSTGCFGISGGSEEHLVEIGADHARLDDHVAVVHQHRHHAARGFIALNSGGELLAARRTQVMVGPRLILLPRARPRTFCAQTEML